MKKNVTYVALPKLLAVASHLGLQIETQKGFVKLTHGGNEDRAMYLGNTKGCGRIDVSGFLNDLAVAHPTPPTSRVEQCIDMSTDEITILKTFRRVAQEGLVERQGPAVVGKRAAGKKVAEPTQEEIDAAVLAACAE
jgi:hypothetical protein